MKLVLPIVIALVGLGAGVGAGMALKPAPAPEDHAAADCAAPATTAAGEHGGAPEAGHGAAVAPPCGPDPFSGKPAAEKAEIEGEPAYVTMDKPFVVPIFRNDKMVATVVASVSVETSTEEAPKIEALKPRLRDSFLAVMFKHANSGGFDGSFTVGRKMEDLKSALHVAATDVMRDKPVGEVLITEINRQDN